MKQRSKYLVRTTAIFALTCLGEMTFAEDPGLSTNGAEANTNVDVNPNLSSNVDAQSGGNVFDFSNNSGRNTPPPPNLPSFAGGPCMGVSGGISATGPGFAVGGARSFEDEACQRRNWVQTLVGVSQHMPEQEANELKRVAIRIMMQDEFVGQAFESLGYDTSTGQQRRPAAAPAPAAPVAASQAPAPQPVRASMGSGCITVVPANAPPAFHTLLEARGCVIQSR